MYFGIMQNYGLYEPIIKVLFLAIYATNDFNGIEQFRWDHISQYIIRNDFINPILVIWKD